MLNFQLFNLKYGINLILPSAKFIECQTIIRNALKSSPNPDIKSLWAAQSDLMSGFGEDTKQVLKAVQHEHEDRIKNTLLSQGLVISSILIYSCQRTASIW